MTRFTNPTGAAHYKISVILAFQNAAATLAEQLAALARQNYSDPWELVTIDHGSRDSSRAIAESWRPRIPAMKMVDASASPTLAAARNLGCAAAGGDSFAFCDADDVVDDSWVASCAKAAGRHELVAGAVDLTTLNRQPPFWAEYRLVSPPVVLGFKPFADSCNMVVSRKGFWEVGGFSEDLQTGSDIDLSWRMQLAGHALHFEPKAIVAKRARASPKEVFAQSARWGRTDVELFRRFRKSGFRRKSLLASLAYHLRRAGEEPRTAVSIVTFRQPLPWLSLLGRHWGRLRASVRLRTFFP